jgi:predicted ArsR family transcriptional regulator
MSNEALENSVRRGADRFLVALKMRGPQTVADLGCATGVCGEAARQQLVRLAAEGLVEAKPQPGGVGRPRQVWSLTPAGNARFADAHGELAADLIRLIRTHLGDDALVKLIEARAAEAGERYAHALEGASDLGEKVARLADVRSREGYMAEWLSDGDGFLLVENHCPTCVATGTCEAFARAELNMLRSVFGPDVSVDYVEHTVRGDRRCAYRIAPCPTVTRA